MFITLKALALIVAFQTITLALITISCTLLLKIIHTTFF